MMTHSAEQFTQQPNAERHALYPKVSGEPEITTDDIIIPSTNSAEPIALTSREDIKLYQQESYVLTHKKILDYVAVQQRFDNGFITKEQLTSVRNNLVHHVTREILYGLPIDPMLHIEDIPDNSFLTHVAQAYISSETAKVTALPLIKNEATMPRSETLFDDDFMVQTAPLPVHITEHPVETMSNEERSTYESFRDIMRKAGNFTVQLLGVSVHSGPTPIQTGPTGTKVLETVQDERIAA